MRYVAPDESVSVARRVGMITEAHEIRVGTRGPMVVMFIDTAPVPLLTPDAHRLGFALIREADLCVAEGAALIIVMTVNGTEVEVPPVNARQIGVALLRRSDFADDFQLNNRVTAINPRIF